MLLCTYVSAYFISLDTINLDTFLKPPPPPPPQKKNRVHEMAVDENGLDEMAVEETGSYLQLHQTCNSSEGSSCKYS